MGATITVKYKFRDGWHVYECDELPGLYVASKNKQEAFNDVPLAVQMLLKLDYGMEVEVEAQPTIQEFAKARAAAKPKPARLAPSANRAFNLCPA